MSVLTSQFLLPRFSRKICVLGLTGGFDGKESACDVGVPGSIPGTGRPPGGGHGNLLFLLGEAPWTEEPGGLHEVHEVTQSQTQLSD